MRIRLVQVAHNLFTSSTSTSTRATAVAGSATLTPSATVVLVNTGSHLTTFELMMFEHHLFSDQAQQHAERNTAVAIVVVTAGKRGSLCAEPSRLRFVGTSYIISLHHNSAAHHSKSKNLLSAGDPDIRYIPGLYRAREKLYRVIRVKKILE